MMAGEKVKQKNSFTHDPPAAGCDFYFPIGEESWNEDPKRGPDRR
jgi:hypothetical protein